MLEGTRPAARTTLGFGDLDELRAQTRAVEVPGSVLGAITELRCELGRQQIVVSDRRWRNSLEVLRAHAFLSGRAVVTEDDLGFLEHVLWKDPEEHPKVRDAIHRLVKGYEEQARELLIQSQELQEYADRRWESDELRSRALVEAHTKIANILVRFDHLVREAAESGRALRGVETMRSQVKEIQQSMLRRI
jgi:MoxR-like ATPase